MTPRSKRNPELPGEYVGRSVLVEEPSTGSYKDGDIHTLDKDNEQEGSRQQSSKSGKQVHYSIDVSIPRGPQRCSTTQFSATLPRSLTMTRFL